jgi:hypothetical protein
MIEVDALEDNADWIRLVRWTLPPYRSRAFNAYLKDAGITLEQFKKRPIYRRAVRRGLIKNDKWAGE